MNFNSFVVAKVKCCCQSNKMIITSFLKMGKLIFVISVSKCPCERAKTVDQTELVEDMMSTFQDWLITHHNKDIQNEKQDISVCII